MASIQGFGFYQGVKVERNERTAPVFTGFVPTDTFQPSPEASERETSLPNFASLVSTMAAPEASKEATPIPASLKNMPAADARKLMQMTDPKVVKRLTLEEAEKNLAATSKIFSKNHDRRGIFPTGYQQMTKSSLQYIRGLKDPKQAAKARTLATDFAQRYFQGLGNHIQGRDNGKGWSDYYKQAQDKNADGVQIFLTGANAHLVGDLPKSLVASGMRSKEDHQTFLRWGQALSEQSGAMVAALEKEQQVDARAFTVSSTVRDLAFGAFRTPAWDNAQRYHEESKKPGVDAAGNLERNAEGDRERIGQILWSTQPAVAGAKSAGSVGFQLENPGTWGPAWLKSGLLW